MIDSGNIRTIAQKEISDALRNKWFLIYTLAFMGLALTLSSFSHPGGRLGQMAGYGRTAASLINLVLLFVPLIGLTLGAVNISGEKETGVLDYLLAQPVSKTEVILGKYAGLAIALLASLCLGFGVAGVYLALRGSGGDATDYIFSVLLAWLLGLSMLSTGLMISVIADKIATAVGTALFIWLTLTFIGDLGLMGAAIVTRIHISRLLLLTMLNPLQLFKMLSIMVIQANLEVLGPAGIYAMEQFGESLIPVLLVGLLLWVFIPLLSAVFIFTWQGNAIQFPHKIRRMLVNGATLLLLAFLIAACGQAEPTPQVLADLAITMAVEPDPPTAGQSTLMITVMDENQQPVDNASIQVHGDMDHAGMTPVDAETSTGQSGIYHVPFEWTMGGGWIVDVTVNLPDGGTATETFELFVEAVSANSIINQPDESTEKAAAHDDHDMDMTNTDEAESSDMNHDQG